MQPHRHLGPEATAAAETLRDGLVSARGRSPLTERLLAGLAGAAERGFDGGALVRLLSTPGPPSRAAARDLLLAALHHAVLRDPSRPLAAWYPTVAGDEHRHPGDGAPAALALAHLVEHEEEIATFMTMHRLQANDVGRAAALLPGVLAAAGLGHPLRLLELGASAGLILHLDRYRIRYLGGPSWGPQGGPRLVTNAEGRVPTTLTPPTIEVIERRGVDLHPLDVDDPRDERLLRSWSTPDDADEVQRLDDAMAVVQAEPSTIDAGDLVAWLDHRGPPVAGATTVIIASRISDLLEPAAVANLDSAIERALRAASDEAPTAALLLDPPRGTLSNGERHVELSIATGAGGGPPTRWVSLAADAHGRWVRWY